MKIHEKNMNSEENDMGGFEDFASMFGAGGKSKGKNGEKDMMKDLESMMFNMMGGGMDGFDTFGFGGPGPKKKKNNKKK